MISKSRSFLQKKKKKTINHQRNSFFVISAVSNHVSNLSNFSSNQHHHHQHQSQHHQSNLQLGDSLIKIILILLCGLLFANSILFYKMWDLEAKLGTPLSNLEEVLVSASKGHGEIDKANLIKILQRQEAAHQIELQKWHDLLGTAAGLLKQVHTSDDLVNSRKIHA